MWWLHFCVHLLRVIASMRSVMSQINEYDEKWWSWLSKRHRILRVNIAAVLGLILTVRKFVNVTVDGSRGGGARIPISATTRTTPARWGDQTRPETHDRSLWLSISATAHPLSTLVVVAVLYHTDAVTVLYFHVQSVSQITNTSCCWCRIFQSRIFFSTFWASPSKCNVLTSVTSLAII